MGYEDSPLVSSQDQILGQPEGRCAPCLGTGEVKSYYETNKKVCPFCDGTGETK